MIKYDKEQLEYLISLLELQLKDNQEFLWQCNQKPTLFFTSDWIETIKTTKSRLLEERKLIKKILKDLKTVNND